MARFLCSAFADEAAQDIQGQIAACKANGIEAIELRGVDGNNISDFTPEEARALKKTLSKAGIGVSSIGSNYGKKGFDFEDFKQTVEAAKILGAAYIRMFSFYGGDKEKAFADVKTMADYAYENGVLCCHENEKGVYGDTAERCLDILKTFEGKILGVFDPSNFIQCGVQIIPAYEMLEPYIDYLHIKDCLFEGGKVVPAGKGDGEIPELLRRFSKKDGERFLTLEPHLKVFKGLESLEKKGESAAKMSEYSYASNEEAFAAAASALHEVLKLV